MKHTAPFKRVLSVLLIAALLVCNVLPVLSIGIAPDGKEEGESVSFTRVDNNEVSTGLTPNGQEKIENEDEYAPGEMVRVSIVLKKASTIDAGYSTLGIAGNKAAMDYRASLKREQLNVVRQIEGSIQGKLDVVWNLTLAANIISAYVPYGQIKTIEKMPSVKSVVLESRYIPYQTEEGKIVANMTTSGAQTGANLAWQAGYTGAGMRIAVIDTGIDTNHQSLSDVAFEYALAQLAEQKGMDPQKYIESLDLLDAEEIARVAANLHVPIDPASACLGSKIAFAYNYRDLDYDVTHDNDDQGDHGSHVAGIAAANSWIYHPASGEFSKAMDAVRMQGVAPEAQLMAMKVFGKGGAAYDSDFFAAIEDALVLGADAINLSLGSVAPGRGHHSNALYEQIMDNLTKSGVVVAISAGNAGAWAESAANGGYLYHTDVGLSTVGQPGSFTNSLCVGSVDNTGKTGGDGTMSEFSSWGVPGSLEMKPEITAPGGNIYSLDGMYTSGTAYAIKSGTSMASPQVAGMAALLAQYIQEKQLAEKTGMDVRHLAQSLLMSTAHPLQDDDSAYVSVLQQGAGLANIYDAIGADSFIVMASGANSAAFDGKVKVELLDDPNRTGAYSAAFTVYNLTDEEKIINLGADFFIQSLLSEGGHQYMDYATTVIGMDVRWSIGGMHALSDEPAMDGLDFNGDGLVSVDDGQRLLDYATGILVTLHNEDKADLDGDGDIDSHDAYMFLRNISTTSTVLPASGSVEICVDFFIPDAMKEALDEAYPNGTYLQGFLYAQTEDAAGETATSHSIPVLGFFGNWTDPSMFDVGMRPTYETGEDSRIPYTGILDGNDFRVCYSDHTKEHYPLGGNPVMADEVYLPQRNAISSDDMIHGIRFIPIRHADQSRILVVNKTTGQVLLDREAGAVNQAYCSDPIFGWQNTDLFLETGISLEAAAEQDVICVSLSLAPEYYVDENGKVQWDALGPGATLSMDLVIDNTAPELLGVSVDEENNTMTVTAADNRYIAAVGLYNKTGTRRLAVTGAQQDIGEGETAEYTFSLEGINGKKFLIQVHDYAMNTATYLIEMQIGQQAGVPEMMAFDLAQGYWTAFTKDFVYDDAAGLPCLEYADHTYYAATIAGHYVFSSTGTGALYVMPEDDLSDTTFIADMGLILLDMAYNKADGNIYAVTENGELVTVDRLSGDVARVGAMPQSTNTLACSPDGTFYFNELGTGKIWSFTLETMNAPVLLAENPWMTGEDADYGSLKGTAGHMGMEYDPGRNRICWTSRLEGKKGGTVTLAYYYEIDPATGEFIRYSDLRHELSCLLIPDKAGEDNSWAEPTDQISGVTLNRPTLYVIEGNSAALVANVQPWTATNRDVSWSSSNGEVAAVDENGVVTGLAPGTATITATSKLDATKTASCQVTVDRLQVTLHGALTDGRNASTLFSWNMATDNTWTPGAALPVSPAAATYSSRLNVYYMMDDTDALQMHKLDAQGNLLASADNGNGIPLWDMAYSETFSFANAEKVTSIYDSYLLSAKDPMALDTVGFDLGDMCDYLIGITSLGSERTEGPDGLLYNTEHLILLDDAGNVWDFWVYARINGGYDAFYTITESNLSLELPGYDEMTHQFTSLVADDLGNLYLAAYTGQTSELYYLLYDELTQQYQAVKAGDLGTGVWPAVLTGVTRNTDNEADAASPKPAYTLSSVTISPEKLAIASADASDFIARVTHEVDATNGVVTVSWDPARMTLVNVKVCADYFAMIEEAGALTVGYVSLEGIVAGEDVVVLTFEAVDAADAGVEIFHKQINNETYAPCQHSATYHVSQIPTTTAPGALEGFCMICGEPLTVDLPALNETDYTYEVVTEATQEWDGCGRYTWKVTDYGTISFDVVIPRPVAESDPQIRIQPSTAAAGDTLRLEMLLKNNPGMQELSLLLHYDRAVMTLVGVSNGAILPGMEVNTESGRLQWISDVEALEDGVLCVLEFQIAEGAKGGIYSVGLTLEQAFNGRYHEVQLYTVAADVQIEDIVYGDANGDRKVNLMDLLMLRTYLANMDFVTGESTLLVEAGADANGDGKVGLADVLLLRQYLANRDPVTGESTVILGPQ